MMRFRYAVSTTAVVLSLALAPAAMAAVGHAGGGFGGHFGGFGSHVGGFGGHVGGFSGERATAPALGAQPYDREHLAAGRGFGGGRHELGGDFADGRRDLGDGIALDGRNIGGNHIMYGRVPRFGRGGVFLGYYYPDPDYCAQYPEYYNPAAGCYGLYPVG